MKSLPKVELHLHLEGAAPPAFIRGLAQEKGVRLDGVFDEHGHYAYKDFPEFLKVYEAATMALKTPDDFARLTTAVLEECAEHGVIYAETFVSPDFCGGGDVGAWREYLAAMVEASNAMADTITLKGIVTCIRHFGPEQAKTAAMCAAETAGDWITGFGMGGAEAVGNAGDYKWSFECAREAGLRLTSHAGEWGGAASVRETLDDLGVERIGHGVQCIQDPALVDRIIAEGIVLEVCPGSNVALGVVPNWESHPITRLRDAGVKVTVSTDDPPFFHTTMTHEFDRLAETHNWDDDATRAVNITAAEAAFCDDATRADLIKKLETQ
jgi:adenosine deaminase